MNQDILVNIDPEVLLEKLGMKDPPFDPYEIAKRIGIPVGTELDWNKLAYDGEIYVNEDQDVKIWVNAANHENRKKFTVAHELGHYVYDVLPNRENFEAIYDDQNTLSFKRDGNKNFLEYRANDFAARLLMPKESLIESGKKIIQDHLDKNEQKITKEILIKRLSLQFAVSEDAMKWRLINLNLIQNGQ